MIAKAPLTNNIGIQRRMTELGRIRLGEKGAKGEPKKLTKFRLTSASRPLLEAAARMYGGTVRAWQGAPDEGFWELYTDTDALDIMVPPVVNAYSQLYETWDAGGCTFRCDGTWESIGEKPCDHGEHEGMQVTTRVSVILPKLPGLGTWRLETKGWNAAATLPAALDLLISAGRTGWLPAILRLEQQSSKKKVPGANGQLRSQTFRYVVPVVDIIGFTFAELFAAGADPALGDGDRPALGAGSPVGQQAPVGPFRPPRGTKVDRPALGPAPALPAVSDFSKPEPMPAPAAPTTVRGWQVEDDVPAPQEISGEVITTDAATGLSAPALAGISHQAGKTKGELAIAIGAISGTVPAPTDVSAVVTAMTDEERGRLADELGLNWKEQ
jgi:hypothetical protein